MKILKRWHERTFAFMGERVKLSLKALERSEAPGFVRMVSALGRSASAAGLSEGEDKEEAAFASLAMLDRDDVREAFVSYVRPAEEVSVDGRTALNAEGFYREGNAQFLMAVLIELERLAVLGDVEGNASGSPSTSTVEAGRATTAEAASTTDESASLSRSIAPETTTGPVPFSRRA